MTCRYSTVIAFVKFYPCWIVLFTTFELAPFQSFISASSFTFPEALLQALSCSQVSSVRVVCVPFLPLKHSSVPVSCWFLN